MPVSSTMTIRISPEVKDKLDRIAADTRRSRSFLAGEAVAAYVERELQIIEGVKQGLTDVQTGQLVPHDEAMAEIYAAIEAARSSSKT
jgi:predicted transcriptional regulator